MYSVQFFYQNRPKWTKILEIDASLVKGSLDPSHFIFEINVGKSRIRHTTTLQLNDEVLDRLKIDEDDVIEIQSRSMSDPTFSDIDFKNRMDWV